MTTIMPHSELLRKAVAHIDETLAQNPDQSLACLLTDAGLRFNLSPLEEEFLARFFKERAENHPQSTACKTAPHA